MRMLLVWPGQMFISAQWQSFHRHKFFITICRKHIFIWLIFYYLLSSSDFSKRLNTGKLYECVSTNVAHLVKHYRRQMKKWHYPSGVYFTSSISLVKLRWQIGIWKLAQLWKFVADCKVCKLYALTVDAFHCIAFWNSFSHSAV